MTRNYIKDVSGELEPENHGTHRCRKKKEVESSNRATTPPPKEDRHVATGLRNGDAEYKSTTFQRKVILADFSAFGHFPFLTDY
jgi:hypothetical protein